MSGEKQVRAALAVMLVVTFGGAALIAASERVYQRLGLAVAHVAALPLIAVRIAVQVLETEAD